ncbi:MAG: TIGR03936 family radical SAM-associated protein [Oscillospiraceae bacterium]|nr:TIGR03936 family radical SAM-associated protein [Oscillospiraceae bacterium]
MSNYILKYSRDDRVKYISHLDFVRLFHRTIRRTGMNFMFSQGFNPHPIMTVAQPLSVGVTSESEYMKVGFDGEYGEEEIVETINGAFPPGYKIIAAKRVGGKEIDLTKLDRAVYTVELEYEGSADIDELLKNKELIVMKKSKSGVKESDIRPYIYWIEKLSEQDGILILKMCISVGNTYNLKPQSVIDAMEKYCPDFKAGFMNVHRNSMMCGNTEIL